MLWKEKDVDLTFCGLMQLCDTFGQQKKNALDPLELENGSSTRTKTDKVKQLKAENKMLATDLAKCTRVMERREIELASVACCCVLM